MDYSDTDLVEEGYVQVEEDDEEDETSEDDQYNRQQFGIYQALPVPEGEGPVCLNPEEATTVEEYLQAVRAQAARCPRVVRVEHPSIEPITALGVKDQHQQGGDGISPAPLSPPAAAATAAGAKERGDGHKQPGMAAYVSQMVAAGATPSCPAWAKPSREWLRQFVHEFAQLRQSLIALKVSCDQGPPPFPLPQAHDAEGWERLCFGRPKATGSSGPAPAGASFLGAGVAGQAAAPTTASSSGHLTGPEGHWSPSDALLPLVARMDQVVIGRLLARHVSELQAAPSLQHVDAQWVYALGSVLEKPVHSDVSAILRALMRRLASLRAGPLQGPHDPQVPLLNIVAAVVGAYFGQDAELLSLLGPDIEMP